MPPKMQLAKRLTLPRTPLAPPKMPPLRLALRSKTLALLPVPLLVLLSVPLPLPVPTLPKMP